MNCFECLAPAEHYHHVVPRSVGGTMTVPLCVKCHGLAHHTVMSRSILTKMALAHKKANGEVYGPVPFGFDAVDGRLVTVKREAKIVGDIIRQREAGASFAKIADSLNALGIEGKQGGRWFANSVRRVINRQAA